MTSHKNSTLIFEINEPSSIRVDKWLTEKIPHLSRHSIQNLIENGHVTINGQILKKKDPIIVGSKIQVILVEERPQEIIPQKVDFDILYQDDHLIVINKPKGIVVHPGAGNHDNTLVNGLVYAIEDFQVDDGDLRPGIVHRLDKDTSGVMLIAKTKEVLFKLSQSFAERRVKKTYLALTIGKPQGLHCNLAIKRHETKRQQMSCNPAGKSAETYFEILEESPPYFLVKASPITGRTHQIRVHLKELKAPIYADEIYGSGKKDFPDEKLMLHAYAIEFNHPISEEKMQFFAPMPEQMQVILEKKLKKRFKNI